MKKKPILFYYEEACDAWVPAPEKVEHIVNIDFKVCMLTDQEYKNLPEN
jgi:hypothetical protein